MNWEDVISYENLYRAHRRARLCKRHKAEVINFENNLSQNLWDLHYQLKFGTYKINGYNKFYIYDPKEREVQAICYKDRVVQHSLCDNYLTPIIDKHLIFDNVACRKGKGSSQAIARLRQFMTKFYRKYQNKGYFVKIDVKKYFANISHPILKDKLKKIIPDKQCLNLLFTIIDSYNDQPERGLPIGNQSSQYLALLYLDSLDRFFKERLKIKYYLRYMDDIVMIVPTRKLAQDCITFASNLLEKESLRINPKSHICPVKNGIEFLGWNFGFSQSGAIIQKIKKSSKKRILAKVKTTRHKAISYKKYAQMAKVSYISYKGLLSKGNAFAFINRLKILMFF